MSTSTKSQALVALLFLCSELLGVELDLAQLVRADDAQTLARGAGSGCSRHTAAGVIRQAANRHGITWIRA